MGHARELDHTSYDSKTRIYKLCQEQVYMWAQEGVRREERNKCLLMITATRSKTGKCFEEGNYGQLLCGRKTVPTSVIRWTHHLALPLMTINMGFM
jgi:hypothetical protein